MQSLRILRIAIGGTIVLTALGSLACDRNESAPEFSGSSVQFVVPSESLTDWVSFAKQVSIVTVVREEQMPAPQEIAERGEGHIPGALTLRIEETLWTAPGARAETGELKVGSLGWTVHDGKLRPLNPEIRPGATYLVAFANFKTGLAPMRPISVGVVGGRIVAASQAARSYTGAWVANVDGLSIQEMRAAFAAAQPEELARRYANLDVEAQVEAVRRAKAGQP